MSCLLEDLARAEALRDQARAQAQRFRGQRDAMLVEVRKHAEKARRTSLEYANTDPALDGEATGWEKALALLTALSRAEPPDETG